MAFSIYIKEIVDVAEARQLKKENKHFCGNGSTTKECNLLISSHERNYRP